MERVVKYSREYEQYECGEREELLSTFLYDLPNLTSCNIFPPLHILNTLLLRGWSGGSMGPRFVWEPFEISEQEYQEILPKLLNPEWTILCDKLWTLRLPMKRDSTFDSIDDRLTWLETVSKNYCLESLAAETEQFRQEHSAMIAEFKLKKPWYFKLSGFE